jgi:hypothetical protein
VSREHPLTTLSSCLPGKMTTLSFSGPLILKRYRGTWTSSNNQWTSVPWPIKCPGRSTDLCMNSLYGFPILLDPQFLRYFRRTSASSFLTRKRSIPQGLYITMKLNALKHGHLTTFPRQLPMSSNMRQTGTLRSSAMKMSTWTPTRTERQEEGCPLGQTHLDVFRPL